MRTFLGVRPARFPGVCRIGLMYLPGGEFGIQKVRLYTYR